jgi:PAS domain S-box-containing protein
MKDPLAPPTEEIRRTPSGIQRNRRKLILRVAVLALICALPIIGLAFYFLSSGLEREITVAEHERAGLNHVRQSVSALEKAVRLAWNETGDDPEMVRELDRILTSLDEVESSVSTTITSGTRPFSTGTKDPHGGSILPLWEQVKATQPGTPDRLTALRNLTTQLHHGIFQTSDRSGLNSGPENEISALTDVVSVCLPLHVERLLHMHEAMAPDLREKGWDDSTRKVAAIFARQLEDEDIRRLDRSINAALTADLHSAHVVTAFQDGYPSEAKALLESLRQLGAAIRPLESGSVGTTNPVAFDEILDSAFEAAVTGWNASIDQLDVLIGDQISEAINRRDHAIALAAIFSIVLLPLAWLYFRFFIRPVMQVIIDDAANHQREAEAARAAADESALRLKQTQAALYGHSSVIVMDLDHRILAVNARLSHLSGYTAEELIGQPFAPFLPADPSSELLSTLWSQVEQGEIWNGNFCQHAKDGRLIWVNATIFPFLNESGKPVEFVVIETDITELAKAREDAEEAVRAKSQFLAMMSHEIRTPLNGVIGFAQLLSDTPLDEGQRDYARTILTSGESLLVIINDILDFSKLEAGSTDLEHRPVALRLLIEDVLDLLAPQARAKKLELVYEIEPGVPDGILADGPRLRQILLNLAGNAVKFTTTGHVSITVVSHPPGTLGFHVRDTGIGIPLDRQHRLFKAFSQVQVSDSRNYGGTGLGLAISQRLVTLMGGQIAVTSSVGQGSDFHFSLPLEAAEVGDQVASRAVARTGEIDQALRGRRFLVVDDLEANQRLLERIFAQYGAEMVAASSIAEALSALDAGKFDLAVLDYMMPGEDGIALARQIRQRHDTRDLPMVLVASAPPERDENPLEFFDTVVLKPLRTQPFAAVIARSLLKSQPSATRPVVAAGESVKNFAASHPLRIAVVDDNAVNLKFMAATLRSFGYSFSSFSDAPSALEALGREPFDLVLMDVQMPGMDGHEATIRLRSGASGELNRHTCVIALTAGAMAEERAACLAAGMDDFISKPVARAELMEKLATASSRAGLPLSSSRRDGS